MVLLEPHDLCSVAQVCSVRLSYSLAPPVPSRHTNASCGGGVQTLNEASSDNHLWRRFCSPQATSQEATTAWKARYMSWLQPRLKQYSAHKSTILLVIAVVVSSLHHLHQLSAINRQGIIYGSCNVVCGSSLCQLRLSVQVPPVGRREYVSRSDPPPTDNVHLIVSVLTHLLAPPTGVGKSAIHARFIDRSYSSHTNHTIGIEFGTKTIELGGRRLKLQGWPAFPISPSDRFKVHISGGPVLTSARGVHQCGTPRGRSVSAPSLERSTEGRAGSWWSTTSPSEKRGRTSSAGSRTYDTRRQSKGQ
jgi:hypothetical protein